ncbi:MULTISPECIES: hypothetical protein [Streptomyces]|uniref:Uncharacterized protein n=1 Tax=Streptomyces virginiae TaxID=1961 RepID=A0ABZ1T408_STRVG|nr:hypothetical protein [Streptomyces virginiae]
MIGVKVRKLGLALAAVRDLREFRDPVSAEELEQFETDVLAGFVLARAAGIRPNLHGSGHGVLPWPVAPARRSR